MLSSVPRPRLGSLVFGTCQSPAAATFDAVRRLVVLPHGDLQGTDICSTSDSHSCGYSQHSNGRNSSPWTAPASLRLFGFGSESLGVHGAANTASSAGLSSHSHYGELPSSPGVPLRVQGALALFHRALQATWWSIVALQPRMVLGSWVGGNGDAGSSTSSSYGDSSGGGLLLARRLPTEPEPFEDEYDDDEYEDGEFVDLDNEDLLGDIGEVEEDWGDKVEVYDDRDSTYDEDDAGDDAPEELGEGEELGEDEELPPPPPPPPRSRRGAWL